MAKTIKEKLLEVAENMPKVHESGVKEGRQAEYDAFWDAFQENGNRTDYSYAFVSWTGEIFKPKYDINLTNSHTYTFRNATIDDLEQTLKSCGVRLNTSGVTNFASVFYASNISIIPEIDCSNATSIGNVFQASKVKTIRKLIVNENATYLNTFTSATSLEELSIEGVIGQNGFDIHWSTKLNKASIESVINALSATKSGLTVTLSKTAVNNAFGIDIDDESTWTFEWLELRGTKSKWTFNYV